MNDINKFGFSLEKLAETENYPWASPEAAVESVMDMSPEEFIESTSRFLMEFEGTEGVWQAIKDFGTWIKNLLVRFWKWITGNSKKDKKSEDKTEEAIKDIKKCYDNIDKENERLRKQKEDLDTVIKETKEKVEELREAVKARKKVSKDFDKNMSDKSTTLHFGEEPSPSFKRTYWAPNIPKIESINKHINLIEDIMLDIISAFEQSKTWKKFMDQIISKFGGVDGFEKDIRDTIEAIESAKSASTSIQPVAYSEKKYADRSLNIYSSYVDEYKRCSTVIIKRLDRVKNYIDKIQDDDTISKNPDMIKIKNNLRLLISTAYPNFKKAHDMIIVNLLEALSECYRRSSDILKSTKHSPGPESEEAVTSYESFVDIFSSEYPYIYEGTEDEYSDISALIANLDADINQYYNDYTFFGTEGKTWDNIKLIGHKVWDAIRRFFMWISSKFSDKAKIKYDIEKLRHTFNTTAESLADYAKYNDWHKSGSKISSTVTDYPDRLKKELKVSFENSSNESVDNVFNFDIYGITSGLESNIQSNITVTDYKSMNRSIEDILDSSRDLAKFHKYFIDMVTTGKANSQDFNKLITKDFQELPNKLKAIKFPGQIKITPADANEFKKEVNISLDLCKEFKSIIDYMEKNKSRIDKFFEKPELKDNKLAKDMIAAMNRYYVPSMKSISDIIDWYVRCINTDIKKIQNATR